MSFNENDEGRDGVVRFADTHRMVNRDLAGGALLDLGVYALSWVFHALYHGQPEPEAAKEAPRVAAAVAKYRTGADETTSVICHFPGHRSMGVATTSMLVATSPGGEGDGSPAVPAIRIQGSKGEIQVAHPAFRPTEFRVVTRGAQGGVDVAVVDCPIPRDARRDWGHGMFWEADECARCVRDGRLQSDRLPWSESVAMMETMEAALRQGGVEYPALITSDVYDAQSPLNTGGTRA